MMKEPTHPGAQTQPTEQTAPKAEPMAQTTLAGRLERERERVGAQFPPLSPLMAYLDALVDCLDGDLTANEKADAIRADQQAAGA